MKYLEKSIRSISGNSELRNSLIISLLLIVVFFTIYFVGGLALSATPAFDENDVLFQLDTRRTIDDMTYYGGYHYRTKVHPLFVLLVNPVGEILQRVTQSPVTASILLGSFFGAIGVALIFVLFQAIFANRKKAVLLAILFGVTASQAYLSIIPGTSSLAVCGLLVSVILFEYSLHRKVLPLIPWILAGIFTLGVTTTNVIQTGICFVVAVFYVYRERGVLFKLQKVGVFVAAVLGITAALAYLQKILYPTTVLFFLTEAYLEDLHYASLMIFHAPGIVLWQLFKNMFMVNFIAPPPLTLAIEGRSLPAISFAGASQFTIFGYAGFALWAGLWLTGLARVFLRWKKGFTFASKTVAFLIGLLLCLVFNLVLHSFYGVGEHGNIEYFLYSGNFTFLILGVFALLPELPDRVMNTLLAILTLSVAINTYLVFQQIIHIYSSLP